MSEVNVRRSVAQIRDCLAETAVRAFARVVRLDVVFYARTKDPVVAVTFDDGPHEDTTPPLLDVLRRHDAKATFFVIGRQVIGNEAIVSRIVAEGHELAVHMMRDEPSVLLSDREFRRQLAQAKSLLMPYADVQWFRPGSGWFTSRMLRSAWKQDLRCVLGTVAAMHDGGRRDQHITRRLRNRARPGSVIVLHEGRPERQGVVATTDQLLDELRRRGLTAVTVSDIVTRHQAPPPPASHMT